MKRCNNCILPGTISGIMFDPAGICNFCLSYENEPVLGQDELQAVIEEAKSRGKRYDCIVPLSGGRDSAYVLYVAKKIYDMNILAINYDNEFQESEAADNVVRVCEALDVEYLLRRSEKDSATDVVKYQLLSSTGTCEACVYGFHSVVYQAAEQHGIPLIIWGNSRVENTRRMTSVINRSLNPNNSIPKKVGRRLRNYINKDWYQYEYRALVHRREFPVPGQSAWTRKKNRMKNSSTREISLFDYLEWDRETIKQTITRELRWKKPDGKPSTWRADCSLHSFENWKFLKQYGCTKDAFGYCNMINAGQMTRAEALQQEEAMISALTEDHMKSLLVEEVGLSPEQSNSILERMQ